MNRDSINPMYIDRPYYQVSNHGGNIHYYAYMQDLAIFGP
jgi:non-homologous end joining protein Ku